MPNAHSLKRYRSVGGRLLAVSTAFMVTLATVVLLSGRVSTARPADEPSPPGFTIPPAPVPLPNDYPVDFSPLDAEVDEYAQITKMKTKASVSGKRLAVAVVDSGVNPAHLSFQGQLLVGHNFTGQGNPDDTTDTFGHGSHVAGIIAARKLAGAEQPGGTPLLPGIAHEAKIVPLKVYNDRHSDRHLSRINEALRWVLDYNATKAKSTGIRIGVVNISLGLDNLTNPDELQKRPYFPRLKNDAQTYINLIRKLFDQHVGVVTAAGNEYVTWGCNEGMVLQAISKETISVGAVYDFTDTDRRKDAIFYPGDAHTYRAIKGRCMPFTQRLGEHIGKDYRTDIFAPGSAVFSMREFVKGDPTTSRVGMASTNGTSFAAPIVAGVVLLLQEYYMRLTERLYPANPLPSVDLVVDCLREGAPKFKDEKSPEQEVEDIDNAKSCGETFVRLDAYQAYESLKSRYERDLDRMTADVSAGRNVVLKVLDIVIPNQPPRPGG